MTDEKIKKLAMQICRENGVELYDIEFKNTDKGKVLRVYITSPEGISLENCSSVSRKLSNELDIIDMISSKYYLEVSSPGLERALTNISHYRQAIGETVKLTYYKENKANTITGILKEVTPDGITIEMDDQKDTSVENIPFASIKKARTVFVMNKKHRR